MDKKVLRERMRKKQQQIRRRKMLRLGAYAAAVILAVVFVIRGIILPIAGRLGGGKTTDEPTEVQAETATETNPNAAIRRPLKSKNDLTKASQLVAGWHEDENGTWYQNTDGTYFAGGMQEIDGVTYCFDDNGYIQTGWVEKDNKDYYFNEDGSYDSTKHKPMICLTFDDGPGEYTSELLDCLEENNAHATFFMVGQNVEEYSTEVQRMVELGCELGNHSWDHSNLFNLDSDAIAKQFTDTDAALEEACGQKSTVARAPYGNGNDEIYNTVQKPFFMWSTDSLDWSYLDADLDYKSVMEDTTLGDGSIVLMHDIHEPSVKAAENIIPDLIAQGYKLVTVSEMAEAKDVTLQYASYSDFWDSSLQNGLVAGYNGSSSDGSSSSGDSTSSEESVDSSSDLGDGSTDESSDIGDGSTDDSSSYSSDSSYSDSSSGYSDSSSTYYSDSSYSYSSDSSY